MAIKFFKKLAGVEDKTPQWDIKPTGKNPAPRKRVPESAPIPPPKKKTEENPFMDDEFVQTMTLESDAFEGYAEENPYSKSGWENNPENEDRRMKTSQIGKDHDANSSGSSFNPYDSGTIRKSWKK